MKSRCMESLCMESQCMESPCKGSSNWRTLSLGRSLAVGLMAAGLMLSLAGPAAAQQEDDGLAAQDAEFVAEGEDTLSGPSQADYTIIDELLARDEASLTDAEGSTYDPGTRRDPFRSLLQRRKSSLVEVEEDRPEGPAGLLVDEIEVEGVFILPDGPVVQIQSASEETSFLLRPGDQLWDGDVVSITLDEVTFKQSVNDPSSLKPYREVVKRIKQ